MPAFDESPEILESQLLESLPPEYNELNSDARQELANGSVNNLGNGPTFVGPPQPLAPRQSQTVTPAINSLAWMRGIEPPTSEAGVPAKLRDTPASHMISMFASGQEREPRIVVHHQPGVSPGNAEAEEEDWDHPYS